MLAGPMTCDLSGRDDHQNEMMSRNDSLMNGLKGLSQTSEQSLVSERLSQKLDSERVHGLAPAWKLKIAHQIGFGTIQLTAVVTNLEQHLGGERADGVSPKLVQQLREQLVSQQVDGLLEGMV